MPKICLKQLQNIYQQRSRHNWHIAVDLAAHDFDLDLSNMDLSGINDWRNVDFAGINLTNANFHSCKLSGASFQGANLTGANFTKTNIIGLTKINAAQLSTISIDASTLPPVLKRKLAMA